MQGRLRRQSILSGRSCGRKSNIQRIYWFHYTIIPSRALRIKDFLSTNQKVGSSSLFRRTMHRTGAEMPRCIFCLYRFSGHTGSGNPHIGSPPPICSEAVKAFYIKVPGSGCSSRFPPTQHPGWRFLPMGACGAAGLVTAQRLVQPTAVQKRNRNLYSVFKVQR